MRTCETTHHNACNMCFHYLKIVIHTRLLHFPYMKIPEKKDMCEIKVRRVGHLLGEIFSLFEFMKEKAEKNIRRALH